MARRSPFPPPSPGSVASLAPLMWCPPARRSIPPRRAPPAHPETMPRRGNARVGARDGPWPLALEDPRCREPGIPGILEHVHWSKPVLAQEKFGEPGEPGRQRILQRHASFRSRCLVPTMRDPRDVRWMLVHAALCAQVLDDRRRLPTRATWAPR